MKLRRSVVYTKGYDYEGTKAFIEGEADCILFDLEDGVSPPNKPAARKGAADMLKNWDFKGKERVVRINAVDTEYFNLDMEEVIAFGLPDVVRIPKSDTTESVLLVDQLLSEIEDKEGLERNTIEIWAMIESPLGIRNAFDIGCCTPRVTALTIGMEDLNRTLGVERRYINNEHDLLYARQKFVLDAKAAGVQALDTVLLTDNDEINCTYTLTSKQMGFDGRAVHNEREIQFANKTFYPAPEAFEWAKRAVAAYEEDAKTNTPTYIDGKFICFAAYRKAKALIAMEK